VGEQLNLYDGVMASFLLPDEQHEDGQRTHNKRPQQRRANGGGIGAGHGHGVHQGQDGAGVQGKAREVDALAPRAQLTSPQEQLHADQHQQADGR
jgi:hypothetical protein